MLILSCSDSKTAILWSSNEEVAQIVEQYNNSNSEFRIIFQYRKDVVSSFIQEEKKPDIIIGEDLQNSDIKTEMQNLNQLFDISLPNRENMIPALMEGININDEKRILPLSFSLTSAVFKRDSKRVNSRHPSLDLEMMKESSVAFNQEQKNRGYSPFWDNDFIFAVLELYQSGFSSSETETLLWQQDNLDSAIQYLKEWNELNGGTEEMDSFNGKFLYDNRIKILKEERILFTIMDSAVFMELSDLMSSDMDFLFISRNFMLHPVNIVYGGISQKASAPEASSDFFSWLINEETQRKIIERSLKDKTGNFAILGGFSSLNSVNKHILPGYYPLLTGKIPEPQYILPQSEKPVDFESMKDTLITAWAIEKSEGNTTDLSDALEKWKKLRIPF